MYLELLGMPIDFVTVFFSEETEKLTFNETPLLNSADINFRAKRFQLGNSMLKRCQKR